ncbi:hypothetical protein ERO13_A09G030800v2 [Gossypium hirsutum]|uniref:Uncharacterized protein n=2 Tax=Gossypium TaxID=3633 RepID=A0A5D2XTB1_GOSMU|nr:hypothetical protein ERO13_A09G030800v2 [Gossypium hirsutum]TYH01209.1 hypothetical protein ES288_A09G039300v1 [Gossypium darwinii]TYJ17196.1 hypothetical protein E1A91_A09G035300v1 [Gossypium mustelinum]
MIRFPLYRSPKKCTEAVRGPCLGCTEAAAPSNKGNPRVSRRFNFPGPFGPVLELGY